MLLAQTNWSSIPRLSSCRWIREGHSFGQNHGSHWSMCCSGPLSLTFGYVPISQASLICGSVLSQAPPLPSSHFSPPYLSLPPAPRDWGISPPLQKTHSSTSFSHALSRSLFPLGHTFQESNPSRSFSDISHDAYHIILFSQLLKKDF